MSLKIDPKFEGKLAFSSKNYIRNLANFFQSIESLKIGSLMASFYPNSKICELKIYRGVICYGNEKRSKI